MATIDILHNVSLKDKTTMKVGGEARFFVSVTGEKELIEAHRFAKEKHIPVFILGGGSNSIISDEGFPGLVIQNNIRGRASIERGDFVMVTARAGEDWDGLVEETVLRGLWGIENLSGIPGSVGAAPVQNIGAYGVELKDVVLYVRAYDSEKGIYTDFTKDDCHFSYRNSLFKKNERFNIVSVTLKLKKNAYPMLGYVGIQQEIEKRNIDKQSLTPLDMRAAVIDIRKRKLPNPSEIPTAGSFFKNPEITYSDFEKLRESFPDLPGFRINDRYVKVPLAWIIEHVCHMKGARVGGAAVYENHALVIVNNGNAQARDVRGLSEKIHHSVFEKTGITIEPEVVFIGPF